MALNFSQVAAGDDILATGPNSLRLDIITEAGEILTDSGSANAYNVTADSQITTLEAGQVAKFKATNANTGAATLRFQNGASLDETDSIKLQNGRDPSGGEITASSLVICVFDGTNWILVSAYASNHQLLYEPNEDVSAGDPLCFEPKIAFASSTTDGPVSNITARTKISFNVIGGGESFSDIKLAMKKAGSPVDNTDLRIETDSSGDPSGTLADANATSSIDNSTLTTGYVDTTFSLAGSITLTEGTTYWVVLTKSGGVDGTNYSILGNSSVATNVAEKRIRNASTWSSNGKSGTYHDSSTNGAFRPFLSRSSAASATPITQFLGFAAEAISQGATGVIDIGQVNTKQSALEVGETYYLSNTLGTIATSAGDNSVKVGIAIDIDKILITRPPPN